MKFPRLFNIFNSVSDKPAAKPDQKPSKPAVMPTVKPKRTKFSAEFTKNHTRQDFNLTEALRLRSLGWGFRRIARQMNNVSRETVRVRLREYDAAEALKSKPVVPPKSSPVTSPQLPHDKPATFPNKPTPTVTLTVPEPVTNLAELAAVRKSRYGDGFPLDLTHIFVVRPEHVKFGLGSEQPVIGFDCWRSEYRGLEMFQTPTQFYVLLNAKDGAGVNRPWLDSIASDIWLRERCSVARVTDVLTVFQSRYAAHRQYPPQAYGKALADDTFERWHKFEPMPLHNHHDLLAELAKDAVPPAKPQEISPYSTGWTAQAPLPPQPNYVEQPRRQEAAGGLCIGGEDTDNWK